MDEERFNLSLRKLLKQFGVTAQREIEKAVDTARPVGRAGRPRRARRPGNDGRGWAAHRDRGRRPDRPLVNIFLERGARVLGLEP